jgi:aminoglycoside phosphotransferase (APT) family kinase protein
MSIRKMHANEVETDAPLVRRLLTAQFPRWADLPIEAVASTGTDNAIYRLGADMTVRLPRIASAIGQVEKEQRWLPKHAPLLPLAIPVPLAMGVPSNGYPWHWGVYPWFEGENATIERLADPRQAAIDLARFLAVLQGIDPAGGPRAGPANFGRGEPLAQRDSRTREAIQALAGTLDCDAATAAWDAALQAPPWEGPPAWIHGDLSSGNLLTLHGRLSAVIDFGCLGVGDPAVELMVAWTLFSGESREAFREALGVDEASWARGRGWALSCALIFIPYYLDTNPAGVREAQRTIDEVLADSASSG